MKQKFNKQEKEKARNEFSQWVNKIRERTKNVDQKLLKKTVQKAVKAAKSKENKAHLQNA